MRCTRVLQNVCVCIRNLYTSTSKIIPIVLKVVGVISQIPLFIVLFLLVNPKSFRNLLRRKEFWQRVHPYLALAEEKKSDNLSIFWMNGLCSLDDSGEDYLFSVVFFLTREHYIREPVTNKANIIFSVKKQWTQLLKFTM